jgi:hypothetical protein
VPGPPPTIPNNASMFAAVCRFVDGACHLRDEVGTCRTRQTGLMNPLSRLQCRLLGARLVLLDLLALVVTVFLPAGLASTGWRSVAAPDYWPKALARGCVRISLFGQPFKLAPGGGGQRVGQIHHLRMRIHSQNELMAGLVPPVQMGGMREIGIAANRDLDRPLANPGSKPGQFLVAK